MESRLVWSYEWSFPIEELIIPSDHHQTLGCRQVFFLWQSTGTSGYFFEALVTLGMLSQHWSFLSESNLDLFRGRCLACFMFAVHVDHFEAIEKIWGWRWT